VNPSPNPKAAHETLGQLLLRQGLITPENLERGLAHKKRTGTRLGQALVDLSFISSEQVSEALRCQGKLTCIKLNPKMVEIDVARKLGEDSSRQHKSIAVNQIAGVTTVAMEDPADVYAIDALARELQSKVFATFAESSEIDECIRHIFEGGAATTNDKDTLDDIAGIVEQNEVDLEAGLSGQDEPEESEDLDGPVINIIQAILKEAFDAKASDIHLEPREKTFVVRFRVDGALFDRMILKSVWARPCIARIKVMSNLDIAQRRLPQDGRTQISVNGRKIDLRVATMPTLMGEGAVIRILDGGRGVTGITSLGLREEQELRLRSMIQNSDGVVLAVGPTGSGKTTTLYSMLDALNKPDAKVITLEDPVENQIETICQINCDAKIGMTFGKGLRAALRQDPDVILVGEIRDLETASTSVQAALTGHLVLSTLHTIGSAETISRMCGMGIENFLLSDVLRGIVAQRLVRIICPTCKEVDDVDPARRELFGLGDDEVFYKGMGCEECNQTGYRGRRGIYEIMLLSTTFRDALRSGANVDTLRDIAIEDGMTTMRQEGIYYARAGQTTIAEVLAKTPRTN
jgi:type IV pilus assembly protein PilB